MIRAIWERRLGSADAAREFLRAGAGPAAGGAAAGGASPGGIPAPASLPRLAEAADRTCAAVAAGERIAVFGHDDPDGVTSCVILAETLEALGASLRTYIPDRNTEGHGLYPELVRRFAADGVTLLVTTDGCSANADEAALAAELGMDVWVTDHHVLAAGRPAVPHLVNPMARPDTAERLGDLTGAGVAALLARELLERAGRAEIFPRLLDLVALGTIADHGDVGRNNRAMTAAGLRDCARGRRPAVTLAAERLGIRDPFPELTARRLAAVFAAIPSVRGESRGVSALLGRPGWREDTEALLAAMLATEEALEGAVRGALAAARRAGILDGAPAVLRVDGVNGRALGAIATRLTRETARPAAVIARREGRLIAELRAPETIHLVDDVLSGMRDLLESWGGHRRAAGFSADAAQEEAIVRRLTAALDIAPDPGAGARAPEAKLRAADVTPEAVAELAAARPFGKGNPEPVLLVDGEPVGAEELIARQAAAAQPQEAPR
jgi:single-stranded-DNA-specific exonuclease